MIIEIAANPNIPNNKNEASFLCRVRKKAYTNCTSKITPMAKTMPRVP